jgi:hypothetical protein
MRPQLGANAGSLSVLGRLSLRSEDLLGAPWAGAQRLCTLSHHVSTSAMEHATAYEGMPRQGNNP